MNVDNTASGQPIPIAQQIREYLAARLNHRKEMAMPDDAICCGSPATCTPSNGRCIRRDIYMDELLEKDPEAARLESLRFSDASTGQSHMMLRAVTEDLHNAPISRSGFKLFDDKQLTGRVLSTFLQLPESEQRVILNRCQARYEKNEAFQALINPGLAIQGVEATPVAIMLEAVARHELMKSWSDQTKSRIAGMGPAKSLEEIRERPRLDPRYEFTRLNEDIGASLGAHRRAEQQCLKPRDRDFGMDR